jgi:hypothetical protein
VKGDFAAALAELIQFQPSWGVGFVFFAVMIDFVTDSTFQSNHCPRTFFLGHFETLF